MRDSPYGSHGYREQLESGESGPVPLEQPVEAADVCELTVSAEPEPPPGRLLNRELSWLDFDERILALAALERVRQVVAV